MDDLYPLNEASILSNIEHRFRLDDIYTRTGPILIAMNPFKASQYPLSLGSLSTGPHGVGAMFCSCCDQQWIQGIYESEAVSRYHNRPYGMLSPHCYQEAEDAYQKLQFTRRNQSIVICGESGAGKTETTKLMLGYISKVAREKRERRDGDETLGDKLVRSNPLMVRSLAHVMVCCCSGG
jgi:myosin heavy subunit